LDLKALLNERMFISVAAKRLDFDNIICNPDRSIDKIYGCGIWTDHANVASVTIAGIIVAFGLVA